MSKEENNHKAKDSKKTLLRLLAYITKKYKFKFIIVLVTIFLSAVAGVSGSIFIRILIDDYITPLLGTTNPVFSGLLNLIMFMSIIYVIGIISNYIYNILMAIIAQGILKDIRDEMFSHMQYLPIKYFDTHIHGGIMSHYTNDTDTLRQMISQSIPQILSSGITVVTVFITMLVTSIPLTIVALVNIFLIIFIMKQITSRSGERFAKMQQSIAKGTGYVEEIMTGQKVVKVFNYEERAKKEFFAITDELCENTAAANTFANILMPIVSNLSSLQYVTLAIVGGIMAINGLGSLTLGMIATFLQLSRNFTMPLGQISQQINSIVMALAGAERIFTLLDEEKEEDEGYVTLVNIKEVDGDIVVVKERTGMWAWEHPHGDGTTTHTRLMGDVRFTDVDFGYNDKTLVIKNITLFAKPGQKIAFVGATGAGKTTITNLINRFYDIHDGKIHYDGINISKIKKDALRRSLGVVLQDTNLFSGTVMENIRYGKLTATDEEVYEAAKLANADSFIQRLPFGYETEISGDGSSLSQGQRQLLSIARAAVANPPVMILDEATSSIDTRTESLVQKGMDKLMHDRTVFVIAHRLSTIRNSKAIMVMDKGEIIERGDHEVLIAEKGRYYQLYTGAFELE